MCLDSLVGTLDWLRGKHCAVVSFSVDDATARKLTGILESCGASVTVVCDPDKLFWPNAELDKAMSDSDLLFFVGQAVSFARKEQQEVWNLNVEATKSVYLAAENAHVGRIVHLSSVFALGHNPDHSPVDGSTPYLSDDRRTACERSLFRQEMKAWSMAERGAKVTVVCGGLPISQCATEVDIIKFATALVTPERLATALAKASSDDMVGKRLVATGLSESDIQNYSASRKSASPIKSLLRKIFNIRGCRSAVRALSRLGTFESQL